MTHEARESWLRGAVEPLRLLEEVEVADYDDRMVTTEGSLLATVRELGVRRQDLLAELDEVEKKLTEAAVALADVGVPEVRVAREAGVSRQTLRVWRGKSDRTGRSKMG